MADLDDVLADLLGEDEDAVNQSYKPSAASGRPGSRGVRGRPSPNQSNKEDEFYRKLAADADEMSDVSEADPAEVAKQLAGLDDMDDALFGGSNKPKTVTSPAPKSPSIVKTPSDKPTSAGNKSSTEKLKKKFDFDDDDPLAGLLSDEEDDKPLKSSLKSSLKKHEPVKDDDEPVSQASSRRMEIDRPPTRSGKNSEETAAPPKRSAEGRRRGDDITFDDEDVLGGMGLDSPRGGAPKKKAPVDADAPREGGAKSILDDLLGTGSVSKHLERPGTGERRQLPFEKKTSQGSKKKEAEPSEEDFQFGSYKPSSAGGGSRPNSRRSVRFEDDDIFSNKPSSAPAGRSRGGASSMLEDMITKDDRDWLDIASNEPVSKKKEEDNRPRSAGHVLDQPSTKPGTSQSTHSEPVDWLGLARLGSPDTTPRDTEKEVSGPRETASKKASPQEDYLGLSSDSPDEKRTQSKTDNGNDDWLKKIQAKKAQRHKSDEPPPKMAGSGSGATDWLGLSDDPSGDSGDWLGGSSSKEMGDDFLGLGKEVDIDSILSKSAPSSQRKADDLFSAPQTREKSDPFVKDRDSVGRGRRDRSPAHKDPDSPRLSPLTESPRGLNATLDALIQMEPQPVSSVSQSLSAGGLSSTSLQQQTALAAAELRQKEELFKQQQQQLAEQQRQQQQGQLAAQQQLFQNQLQQQLQTQQEQLRKQQEQQLLALQQKQQQMQTNLTPAYPQSVGMNFGGGSNLIGMGMFGDVESMISKLQAEKLHLQTMIETIRQQHQEELKVMEDSFRKRTDLIEDSFKKRENRLKEENEMLSEQSMSHLKLMEQEKANVITGQLKKQEMWERDKENEIDRLKEHHRREVNSLRQEQDEALSRLRKAKDREVEAVISAHDHARQLHSVIDRVDESARDLSDLHHKVEGQHMTSLEVRENAATIRDHQLKALQERLERQSRETEQEKSRLQGLITKLEMQLTEQSRELEEEKWRVRQEENRMKTTQKSLEHERNIMTEQVQKDKMDLEKMKSQLLEDQQTSLAQISDERRQLAEEKAQFHVSLKLKQDQELRDSTHRMRSESEVESTVRALNDEKARLARIAKDLELDNQKLLSEKEQLDQQRQLLGVEKQKLEQLALQVRQRSQDIEDVCTTAARAQEEGQKAMMVARAAETDQQGRVKKINAEFAALRQKEKVIAQERLSLAREKQELDLSRANILCVSCRTPIKDTANKTSNNSIEQQPKMTRAAQILMTNLGLNSEMNSNLEQVSQAIEIDRSVRKWRVSATKDKEFLEEESLFLEAIKHAPYHPGPS